jgi:hypothetical protein
VESSRDKVIECMKTSNIIHELLEANKIDKVVMLDILFQDRFFRCQLGLLLFKMRSTIIRKKLEDFLYSRIDRWVNERSIDKKLMTSLSSLQTKFN